jgi:colanic acid/amylovoran biosynthesis glycosyltransferase
LIQNIQKRTKQWWQPKAGLILSIVYLAFLLYEIPASEAFLYIIPSICTILGIGIFGHILNDWADLEADKKVGKSNMLEGWHFSQKAFFLSFTLFLAFFPWVFLPWDELSISLITAEFFLLVVYALPPFRVKTRGILAIINDALYAYAIPALLAFHTFVLFAGADLDVFMYVIIFFWQFSTGVFNMMIHQLEDRENDINTNTHTWASKISAKTARRVALLYSWPIMLTLFVGYIVFVGIANIWGYLILLPLLVLHYRKIFRIKPYRIFFKSPFNADLQQINLHYHLFLPYWHILLLLLIDVNYLLLFFGHFIVFNYHVLSALFKKFIYPLLFSLASYTVNYSIYYFRRFILFESVEVAMRGQYAQYKKEADDKAQKENTPNVVVLNSNINKYTETFVRRHIEYLNESGYYTHQLYGDNLPNAEVKRGLLISNNQEVLKWKEFLTAFFDREDTYNVKKSLKEYLLNHNASLVLAEFGQSGAEIAEICNEIEVPLIVVFYGYDAHHKNVLESYAEKYLRMFEVVCVIVCVSLDIVGRLCELGAPPEKLFYLPCAVDLSNYTYKDHSDNPPIFLSVGRFAETKSPHLTILAFNEVLKQIPEARLRMVGKDGGGELFEACHILVKALKIEDKVAFLGVLTPEEVKKEMDEARVFVQHSLMTPLHNDKEGTPVAIMEAMASGLPIVATRHAGIAELIQSGENGILVEEYDYLAMANAMVNVCKSDELVYQLGKKAAHDLSKNELISKNKKFFIELIEKHRLYIE